LIAKPPRFLGIQFFWVKYPKLFNYFLLNLMGDFATLNLFCVVCKNIHNPNSYINPQGMVIEKLHNNFFSVDDGIRYPRVDQAYIYIYIYSNFVISHNGDCPHEEIAKFS
jgi:hypothetical protein